MAGPVQLGVPTSLSCGCLPTQLSVFNFSVKVRQDLRHNASSSEVLDTVFSEVKSIWNKTEIPKFCETDKKKVKKTISEIITKGRSLQKTPVGRRASNLGSILDCFLDLSHCNHYSSEECTLDLNKPLNCYL